MRNAPDDFDWQTDEAVAVRSQASLAVYANKDGEVIVREQAQYPDKEDRFIIINREHIPTFVRHLRDAAGRADIKLVGRQAANPARTSFRRTRPDIDFDAVIAEFEAKFPNGVLPQEEAKPPKDKTGAERQKRLREKKRNGGVTANGDHC